jgi:hypothetical protein
MSDAPRKDGWTETLTADGGVGSTDPGNGPAFEEVQRFRGRWTLIGTAVLSVACVVSVVVFRTGSVGTVAFLATAIVLPLSVGVASLRTVVDDEGVELRLVPVHLRPRVVRFEDVVGVERVSVKAFRDYGGVGVRLGRDSWAYIVTSGEAVRLERVDRPDVVVGSAKREDLHRAIQRGRGATRGENDPGGR